MSNPANDRDVLLRNLRAAAAVVVGRMEAWPLVGLLCDEGRPDPRTARALLAVQRAEEYEQEVPPDVADVVLAWCDTLLRAGGAGLVAREVVRAQATIAEKVERERQTAVIPALDGGRWLAVWRRNGETLDFEPKGGEWWHRPKGWTAKPGESVIRFKDEVEKVIAWQWGLDAIGASRE